MYTEVSLAQGHAKLHTGKLETAKDGDGFDSKSSLGPTAWIPIGCLPFRVQR